MKQVFFDLETIPSQEAAVKAEIFARPEYADSKDIGTILPAANLKDPDKIAESIRERTAKAKVDLAAANIAKVGAADKAWRDTSLDGWLGSIGCIAWAIDDEKVQAADSFLWGNEPKQSLDRFDERNAITEFFAAVELAIRKDWSLNEGADVSNRLCIRVEPVVLIGHNVRRFDIIFLWQRCVVLGIPIPNWLAVAKGAPRFSDEFVIDTMELAGNTLSTPFGPKLDKLCRALGIQTKTGIDGSKVWDAYLAGRFSDVREYCCDDVRCVRSAFRRLTGLPMLAIDVMTPPTPASVEAAA